MRERDYNLPHLAFSHHLWMLLYKAVSRKLPIVKKKKMLLETDN